HPGGQKLAHQLFLANPLDRQLVRMRQMQRDTFNLDLHKLPRTSKYRRTASIPRKKFGKYIFSLGAWRLSSGRPKPIITLGMPRCLSNSPTIGIDPPERI